MSDVTVDSPTPPTAVRTDDSGVIVEYENGSKLYRVVGDGVAKQFTPAVGYVWNNVTYSVDDSTDSSRHERLVHVGNASVVVKVPNYLGTVRILGPEKDGGVFVLVEDVNMTGPGPIEVQQSVWHLDAGANVVNVSLIPIEEQDIRVDDSVTISASGEAIAIVAKRNAVQFWKLNRQSPTILSSKPPKNATGTNNGLAIAKQDLITYTGTCLTSAQMTSNVQEYLSVSQSMTSNNINNNGTCTLRTKPSYLTNPGTYGSVSYNWNGWDTPSGFISAMNAGGKAGNLNIAYSLTNCAYGVDCSGFVTRVWGFTDWKRSTNDIPGSATSKARVYGPGYYVGDALNLAGSHVVLFSSLASNGLNIWESCGEPYSRVVSRQVLWSYVSGYIGWRSKTSCN